MEIQRRRLMEPQTGVELDGGIELGYIETRIHINEQLFSVILDTGSPLLIVPCNDCNDCGHHNSLTPIDGLGRPFSIRYVEGSKLEGHDVLSRIQIERMQFEAVVGCANVMTRLFRTQEADGIMGLDEYSVLRDLMRSHPTLPHTFALHLQPDFDRLLLGLDPNEDQPDAVCPLDKHNENFFTPVHTLDVHTQKASVSTPIQHLLKLRDQRLLVDSGTTYIYFEAPLFRSLKAVLQAHGFRSDTKNDIGCSQGLIPIPTLVLRGAPGCDIVLYPKHWTTIRPNGEYCAVIFDTGVGNENTLGLSGLDWRRSTFVFDGAHPRIQFSNV